MTDFDTDGYLVLENVIEPALIAELRPTDRRTGLAMNYCAGWIRPLENQQLAVPFGAIRSFSPWLQELCGFSVYNGPVGSVELRSPASVFFAGTEVPSLWAGE